MFRRRTLALLTLCAIIGLSGAYSALAVYKAIDYTTTPRHGIGSATPADVGLPYEEVAFPSRSQDALPLSGWWIESADATRAIVLAHGRYQNRTSMLALARPLWERGYSVLLFDLRGHGASPEASASYGLREQWDIVGAVEYVEGRGFGRDSIGVLGWSLGAASALMAMEHEPGLAAVVSDSAYANGSPLLARNALRPGLKIALRLVNDVDIDKVRPAQALSRTRHGSVLLIHGEDDRSVPVKHAHLLKHAGGERVIEPWIVPNAGHISAFATYPDEYINRVLAFFDSELA